MPQQQPHNTLLTPLACSARARGSNRSATVTVQCATRSATQQDRRPHCCACRCCAARCHRRLCGAEVPAQVACSAATSAPAAHAQHTHTQNHKVTKSQQHTHRPKQSTRHGMSACRPADHPPTTHQSPCHPCQLSNAQSWCMSGVAGVSHTHTCTAPCRAMPPNPPPTHPMCCATVQM